MNNDATKSAAIDTLRSLYRATRAGAPLDGPAYVTALLEATADGADDMAITRAFERLGYVARTDLVGMYEGAGSRVRAALAARGWQGAIRVASLLGLSDVWAAAMTAHYGPVGTHASRCGADGVPTVETLAEFPGLGRGMAEAAERFEHLCGWYDRHYAGRAIRWEHVVYYSETARLCAPKAA